MNSPGALFLADLVLTVPFDLPFRVGADFDADEVLAPLRAYTVASFDISSNRYVETSKPALIEDIRWQYRNRLRSWFRDHRDTRIVELQTVEAYDISLQTDGDRVSLAPSMQIIVTAVTHGIGSAVLSVTLRFPHKTVLAAHCVFPLRNPSNIVATLPSNTFGLETLSGRVSMEEVALQLPALIFASQLGVPDASKTVSQLRTTCGSPRSALTKIAAEFDQDVEVYPAADVYPSLLLRVAGDNEILQKTVEVHKAVLRGWLTGDSNWVHKKSSLVDRTVPRGDVSSRDSIAWFVEDNGTVKLFSDDFATSFNKSLALIMFELDVLLTEQLGYLRTNYYLRSDGSPASYTKVLRLAETLMRDIAEFYSSTVVFKDTTAARIDFLRLRFRLNTLREETDRALDAIRTSMQAESEQARFELSTQLGQRQALLAAIFAAFGSASIAADVLLATRPKDGALKGVLVVTLVAFVGAAALTSLFSYFILKRR